MKKTCLLISAFVILALNSYCQQWGLYTFYSPQNTSTAYLVDTSGTTYKSWTGLGGSANTGYSAYLIPGDTIVRSVTNSGNVLSGGGITGKVQKCTWNGTAVWTYTYSSSTYCLHHDICPMPNGNVLCISYDVKTSTEATQAGASSASQGIYSEKIVEIKPSGSTGGTIVWEWKLWDHLCQEYSSSKDNYVSDILNYPQLMDINVGTSQDRFHMNGIDYNVDLDQIVVSMHYPNEVFVIDHSTTTAQAATHTGGNAGKGGDFLYRWGNPSNYDATGTTIFNDVHDAHWVPSDNPNYPNYLCAFNNKGGTSGKSAFTIWNPPLSGYNYTLTSGSAYTPSTYNYQYTSSYSSSNMGNSQQLPNGNSLMCIPSSASYIIEVNSSGTNLWSKTVTGTVVHAYRYDKCYVRGPQATCGSATTVCAGTAVNLTSSATSVTETSPTYSYSWTSSPSGFTSSSQNPTFSPTTTTTFTVVITNTALGCSDDASVVVNVNPLPATPVITQNGSELISSTGYSYQWYLNGSPVSGANSQNYTPTEDGSYQVEITDINGCSSALSGAVIITEGQIMNTNNEFAKIYPNPTSGKLDIITNISDNYEVELYDIYGKLVFDKINVKSVDISFLENGMYTLTLKIKNHRNITQKVVLMK